MDNEQKELIPEAPAKKPSRNINLRLLAAGIYALISAFLVVFYNISELPDVFNAFSENPEFSTAMVIVYRLISVLPPLGLAIVALFLDKIQSFRIIGAVSMFASAVGITANTIGNYLYFTEGYEYYKAYVEMGYESAEQAMTSFNLYRIRELISGAVLALIIVLIGVCVLNGKKWLTAATAVATLLIGKYLFEFLNNMTQYFVNSGSENAGIYFNDFIWTTSTLVLFSALTMLATEFSHTPAQEASSPDEPISPDAEEPAVSEEEVENTEESEESPESPVDGE